jgi:hypothetical protein
MTTRMIATDDGWHAAARLAPVRLGAADWLCLAAAPTFAVMALLTAVLGGPQDVLCAALHDATPLGGMVWMYMLMSAFHLAPWLKLISGRHETPTG